MSFTNKVILITGGSSGIGAATAIQFAKEGADVTIVGRNETKLNNVAAECAKVGKKPLVINADVSKDDEAKSTVKQTIDAYGKLDVLVNNAGIARFVTVLDGTLLQKYDEVMSTNLRSVVHLTSLSVPHLVKTKGNIVNISSYLSTTFLKPHIVYGTSKAGLDYFTKACALDLAATGVRVNAVNPGYTRTDIAENAGVTVSWDEWAAKTPVGKVIEPEEIANMIMYLVSEKSKSVTGATVFIDNGAQLVRASE